MNQLESQILRLIDESPSRVNFNQIKNGLRDSDAFGVETLKQALANLISSGTLCYTFHFGRSFIERSLERPLHVSEHVILKPPRCSVDTDVNSVVVSIEKGASFGSGDHPTTRMVVQLIDECFHQSFWIKRKADVKAIDIGTGSGILSIVAAKLGAGTVIGVDSDPCSRHEAKQNVTLNQLNDRIRIQGASIFQIDETFDLVLANLRTPTLISLCGEIDKKLNENSVLIFSGMKEEESSVVCKSYRKIGFRVIKTRQEKGWGAVCLSRGQFFNRSVAGIS